MFLAFPLEKLLTSGKPGLCLFKAIIRRKSQGQRQGTSSWVVVASRPSLVLSGPGWPSLALPCLAGPRWPSLPFLGHLACRGVGHGALSATSLFIFGSSGFSFLCFLDPARFKGQVYKARGIKAAADSQTFMFLGPSLLAVSGPTCNCFAGASVGKERKTGKGGQPATACTQAWACDVVRPLCTQLSVGPTSSSQTGQGTHGEGLAGAWNC